MENRKNYNINNLCDSCLHILAERGEIPSDAKREAENNGELRYCYNCGQPILSDINQFAEDLDLFESALSNKKLKVICYTAPSVRVALGDEFNLEPGSFVEGKMVAALKKLGAYAVFDMNTAADFTIIEEANEFVERLRSNKNLPLFTSCCPGWVNYALKVRPELINNLSTTKSPQQMFGALINNVYAKANGIKNTDLFVVSIVPCLAKKLELKQANINSAKGFDVDVAITTRELASLIKSRGINFAALKEENFDNFFGASSGAGAIFGNTGGVMEAVLRTVGDTLTGSEQKVLDYEMVRGLDAVRRATLKFGEREIRIAVVTGLKQVDIVLNELKENKDAYHFVEVMACDGGCIGGPGQPLVKEDKRKEVLQKRAASLYNGELKKSQRKAHKNPAVLNIYNQYLGGVGGKLAKKLLHRKYTKEL